MPRRPRHRLRTLERAPAAGVRRPPARRASADVQAAVPARASAPPSPAKPRAPDVGHFLWTCRAGFEPHLFEELVWAIAHPQMVAPGLVASACWPATAPTFARMGFRVDRVLQGDPTSWTPEILKDTRRRGPLHVQSWAPDVESTQPLHGLAREWGALLTASLPALQRLDSPEIALASGGTLLQVCWLSRDTVAVGRVAAREAISIGEGGRRRMRRAEESPSRAAMKLEEALTGLSMEPGRGDVCADLGAAPGGWTQRLVARGAHVIAVDPAKLQPALTSHRRVRHVMESAFAFEPEEPVDWLFCDMAWRPLEVAQLLAKWARRGWAHQLVANIKLPMKDKNPVLLRVRRTLEQGGWTGLRIRQLYHDRDEVTVTAQRVTG